MVGAKSLRESIVLEEIPFEEYSRFSDISYFKGRDAYAKIIDSWIFETPEKFAACVLREKIYVRFCDGRYYGYNSIIREPRLCKSFYKEIIDNGVTVLFKGKKRSRSFVKFKYSGDIIVPTFCKIWKNHIPEYTWENQVPQKEMAWAILSENLDKTISSR